MWGVEGWGNYEPGCHQDNPTFLAHIVLYIPVLFVVVQCPHRPRLAQAHSPRCARLQPVCAGLGQCAMMQPVTSQFTTSAITYPYRAVHHFISKSHRVYQAHKILPSRTQAYRSSTSCEWLFFWSRLNLIFLLVIIEATSWCYKHWINYIHPILQSFD